ncbi:MAG: hypothetical protein PHE56_09775, partial [Bacteroidales bacterium]|nr:hypothetical protein [Bacteroidales bacterium]
SIKLIKEGGIEIDPMFQIRVGGKRWSENHLYTPEIRQIASGRKDQLEFTIEHYGMKHMRAVGFMALHSLYCIFNEMEFNGFARGLAFGHSPDMVQIAAWALMGFPPTETLPNGGNNLAEGTGWRFHMMPDKTIQLGEFLAV